MTHRYNVHIKLKKPGSRSQFIAGVSLLMGFDDKKKKHTEQPYRYGPSN